MGELLERRVLLSTIQVGQLVPSLSGSADDTAAIQSAINSSAAGDTLHFATGTYLLSQSLNLLPDRNYIGDVGSTLEMSVSASPGTEIALVVAGSDYEINLQGLTFNASDVGGGIDITVNGGNSVPASNVYIINDTFINMPGTGGNPAPPAESAIYEPVGMVNSAVEGNIFLNDGGCISLADPDNLKITGNTFTNIANSGIFIPIYNLPFTYGSGVSISNNTMTNLGGNGIELFGAGGTAPTSLVIDSNTMTNFTGTTANIFGISAVTGTGTQVWYNVIQGGYIGTGIEIGGTNDAVEQNVISGFTTGITIGTTVNSTISNNLIEFSDSVGITKYNAGTSSGLAIHNNLLVNPQNMGIWMNADQGWAGSIQSNVILRTAGYWANDSGFFGISLVDPSGVSSINDNVISLNATAAPSGFNFEGILNNGYGGNFAGSSISGNVVVATGSAIGSGLYGNGQGGFNGMAVTGNTLQNLALAAGGGAFISQTGNIAINDLGLGYLTNATVISATPPTARAVLQATASTPPAIHGDASATTSVDGITSYSWLFSDGVTTTGTVTTHQYNASAPSPLLYGCAALVVQDQNGSYATVAGPPTIVIGTKSQTITFTAPASPIAYSAGETVTLNATGGGSISPVIFSIDPNSTAIGSISGNTLTINSGGTLVLDANQAGDFNYAPALQVQQTLVVSKSNQSINFTALASPVTLALNETIVLSATGGGSGNAVVFSVDPASSGTGTISGSTLTLAGAGTLVIDANQAGSLNFNAATQVQQSLVVLKGTDAISFIASSSPISYAPGEKVTLTASAGGSSAPVVFSVDPSSTATGNISGNVLTVTCAGMFIIDANQAGDTNYSAAAQVQATLVVSKAAQTILFVRPASPVAFVQGETISFTATGGASGNPVVLSIDPSSTATGTINGSTLTVTTGGTFFIDANQAGNNNYTGTATVQQWLYVGSASAPVVTTGSATQLSMTGATLNATVNPDASTTSVLFQLSTSSTFTPTVQTQVASGFSGPHGLAVNAAGDLFVADTFNNQVKEIFPNGNVQLIGSGFSFPAGVAVNSAGDVFVADYGNNLVKEVLPNGTIQTIGSGFNQPFDVAVDSSGDVFVADFGNNAVKEVLPNGVILTIGFGFSGPSSVAVDASGDMFVADTFNSQVKEVLPNGTIKTIGSGFSGPSGVAVDTSGTVYVADTYNNAAKEVLVNGTIKTLGSSLNSPAGIAVDGAGDVYLADTNNARVLELAVPLVAATPSSLTGSTAMAVTATLTGLTPGTVYYYRPVAANAFGMTDGATASFTAATTNSSPGTVNITSGNSVYTGAAYTPAANVTGTNGADTGAAITYTYYTGLNISGTSLTTAPSGAGTYTVVAIFHGDGEYTAASAFETFQITPKALTVASVSASGKIYDGTTTETAPTILLTGVIGSDTVTANGSATFASPVVGAETVYITGITLAGAQAADYTVTASASTNAIITPKMLTIASIIAAGKTYDGTTNESALTLTLSGVVGTDNVTATGSAVFANASAGSQAVNINGITLSGAQAGNYVIASNASTSAIIAPKSLTIASVTGKTYDGTTADTSPTFTLGGIVGSDNVSAIGTATFNNASAGTQTLNITGLTLGGAQAGDYTIASYVSSTAIITPKALSIVSVTAPGKTYDGTTGETAPAITLGGIIGSDSVSATGAAAFISATASVETVTVSGIALGGAQAGNYTVASNASTTAIITPKALTIASVTAAGKVYDGTTGETSPTIALGGVIGADSVTATGSAAFANASAGVETVNITAITLSGPQAVDYSVASNASTTAVITAKTLTIASVSAAGKIYDGTATEGAPTITLAGVIGSDNVTASGWAVFTAAAAGVETVNISGITLGGAQAGDYTITANASSTAVITPAVLTIASLTAAGKIYDGTIGESAPTITLAGVIGADNVSATGTAAFSNVSAGVETVLVNGITLNGAQAGDYTIASNASTTATITAKTLTVLSVTGKTYDGTTSGATATIAVNGVVGSDNVTATGTATFANASAGVESVNITSIMLGGAQAGDYSVGANASTSAIIAPKALAITALSAAGKTYDGTTSESTPTIALSGVIGADIVTATGTAAFANASAGVETVNITSIALNGAQAGDYTIAANASATAIITPKTLTIASVTAAGKTYDGTTGESAPAIALTGVIGTDSVAATGTAAFANASAGVETVRVTGITLGGAQAGDYTIASNASTTAVITPRALTITTVTAAGKTYDATTAEVAPTILLGGVIGPDGVTATGIASFANESAGVETVNITGITLRGAQASDYTIAANASTTAIITPKALTVATITALGKTYDGTTSETVPTIALGGVIGTDGVTANGAASFANASAGVERVNVTGIALSGAQAGDYSVAASASTSAVITAATPVLTVTDSGGVYTGLPYAATATVTGVSGVPAAALEGVVPTLLYYNGAIATGTGFANAPAGVGTYTVVGTFAGSTDYAAVSSQVVFTIRPQNVTSGGLATITKLSATKVSAGGASLAALVNPNGSPAAIVFQYSTTPTFSPTVQSVVGHGFSGPHGVAVDKAGDLFVADTFNNAVKEVFPTGTVATIGSGFSLPVGVSVDSSGDVFVADYGHNAVKEVLANGTIQTLGSGFNQPFDVAVDATGDVVVADFGNNQVKEVSTAGVISTIGSGFSGPSSVAVDSSGDVFVADTFNSQVKEVLPGGAINIIGSGFSGPGGVAVDSSGDVFVADSFNNQLKEVSANGTIQTLASGLNDPGGVAVDSAGNVFVADTSNARVLELSPPTIAATPANLTGSAAVAVSATLTGLSPGTVYYYRAVAYSPAGTVLAAGQFTTAVTPGMADPSVGPAIESAHWTSSGQSSDAKLLDGLLEDA